MTICKQLKSNPRVQGNKIFSNFEYKTELKAYAEYAGLKVSTIISIFCSLYIPFKEKL